jgi:hypothetical protein
VAVIAAVLSLLSPSAFAETSGPVNSSQMDAASSSNDQKSPNDTARNSGSAQSAGGAHGNAAAVAQTIRQDLQNAGFTDVKVIAESFVVQAKSRDGNPVVMTIGPHGMSVFEAMGVNGPNSSTVGQGSAAGSSAGSNANSPSSQPSGLRQQ